MPSKKTILCIILCLLVLYPLSQITYYGTKNIFNNLVSISYVSYRTENDEHGNILKVIKHELTNITEAPIYYITDGKIPVVNRAVPYPYFENLNFYGCGTDWHCNIILPGQTVTVESFHQNLPFITVQYLISKESQVNNNAVFEWSPITPSI